MLLLTLAGSLIACPAQAAVTSLPTAPCPDSFSVCAPPAVGLGRVLLAVPALGLLLAAIAGIALLIRERARLRLSPVAALLIVAGITTSLALHALHVPAGPMVYYDEFLHDEATANIAQGLSPHPCCGYRDGQCIEGGPIMWPLATHVASALVMVASGDKTARTGLVARATFNRLVSLLSPVLVFLWIVLLLGDEISAALAAVAYALWPAAIRLQTSGDLSPGAVFFMLGLLCVVEWWRRHPTLLTTFAMIGLLALTCHARLEMALVLPWIFWRSRRVRVGPAPGWMIVLPAAALVLAPLVGLYLNGARAGTPGWTVHASEFLAFLRHHVPGNLSFFLNPASGSPAISALAVAGLLTRTGRSFFPLAATALGFFLFDSSYYIGSFDPTLAMDGFRYTLPIFVLLLPLATATIQALSDSRRSGARKVFPALVLAALIAPIPWQTRFLSQANKVGTLDALVASARTRETWSGQALFVTRSVAFTRVETGAANIAERCSVDDTLLRQFREAYYLRSWSDGGAASQPRQCGSSVETAPQSPDRSGPWLYRYSPCAPPK